MDELPEGMMASSQSLDSDRILFVRLSDLHVQAGLNALDARMPEIAKVLNGYAGDATVAVIALTGDVADRGKTEEYERATKLLEPVIDAARSLFPTVHVVTIPGNHDCDLDENKLREGFIASNLSRTLTESELIECSRAQSTFWQWAATLPCQLQPIRTPEMWFSTVIERNGRKIQIIGGNTAALSTRDDRVGTLQVNLDAIPAREDDADLTVTLIHHPLHWINQDQRLNLTGALEERSEIILTGHEHQLDEFEKSRPANRQTMYIAASALQARDTPETGFSIFAIDLRGRVCVHHHYGWTGDSYGESRIATTHTLQAASDRRRGLYPKQVYLKEILDYELPLDHRSGSKLSLTDVFEWPDLRAVTPRDNLRPSMAQPTQRQDSSIDRPRRTQQSMGAYSHVLVAGERLLEAVLLNGTTLIVGEENSGKTTLLGRLYDNALRKRMYPLMIEAAEVVKRTPSELIREAIARQYGDSSVDAFLQLPKADRILLIDDLDDASDYTSKLCHFAKYSNELFGTAVVVCTDILLLQDPIKQVANETLWSFAHYEIMPFADLRRSNLVKRWVCADRTLSDSDRHRRQTQVEESLRELLNSRLLPSHPLYLLWLLESIDGTEQISDAAGAFGYHYERMILQAIHMSMARLPIKAREVTDDILLEILSRLAFSIFKGDLGSLSKNDIEQVIEDAKRVKKLRFETSSAFLLLRDAGLLQQRSCESFNFNLKYVYYYSVARYLEKHRTAPSQGAAIQSHIANVMDNLHTEANANILIFYVFLSRDLETVKKLLAMARDAYAEEEPCRFKDDFYIGNDDLTEKPLPDPGTDLDANRKNINTLREQEERRAEDDGPSSLKDIKELVNLRKALRTIQIIGQVLRVAPAHLDGDEKVALATETYELGLRALTEFVGIVRRCEAHVQAYFRQLSKDVVRQPDMLAAQRAVRQRIADLLVFGGYSFVRRVSRSLGSPFLRPVYEEIAIPGCEISVQLINKAIALEFFQELSADMSSRFYEKVRKERWFGTADVLRRLVWDHLYLYPSHGADRAKICSIMGIDQANPALLAGGQKFDRKIQTHLRPGKAKRRKKKAR